MDQMIPWEDLRLFCESRRPDNLGRIITMLQEQHEIRVVQAATIARTIKAFQAEADSAGCEDAG